MPKTPAVPLLLGAGAVAFIATKKKKKRSIAKSHWGVYVSSDCQTIELRNKELFRQFLIGGYKELIDADPNLDVFQISDALFGEVAPHCNPFPEDPKSIAIVEFYVYIISAVTAFMVDDGKTKIKEVLEDPKSKEFLEWYSFYINPPSSILPIVPSDQISFASDFSRYRIGNDWYEKTLKVYVEGGLMGRQNPDQIYQNFIENRAVLYGKAMTPIVALPTDQPKVAEFLQKIKDSISRAISELS